MPPGAGVSFERDQQDGDALDALMDRWLGWRAVVMDARPMAARDILGGEGEEDVAMNIADLERRASATLAALSTHAKAVLKALPEPQEGNVGNVQRGAR